MAGLRPSDKCQICKEIPTREIFLCDNGHNSCYDCAEKSPTKFQGKIRNLALEFELDDIHLDCIYKTAGCNQTFSRRVLKEHILACDYSPVQNPPLCKMIGYPACQFSPSAATRAEILEHFLTKHPDDDVCNHNKASWVAIRLEETAPDCARHLYFLGFDNNNTGPLVLILRSYRAATKVTSWLCVLLWADRTKGDPNITAVFAFESADKRIRGHKWMLPAIDIKQAKSFLEAKEIIKTPLLIEQFGRAPTPSTHSRYVAVKIKLMQRDDPTVEVRATPGTNGAASSSSSSTSIEPSGRQQCISRRGAESIQRDGICDGSCIYDFDDPMIAECDACKMEPICGYGYVCIQCEDTDLCSKCVKKGNHSDHILVVVRNSAQQKKMQRWTDNPSRPKILQAKNEPSKKGRKGVAHLDLNCKHCKKRIEVRLYSCLTCPAYYLCAVCVAAEDQHSHDFFAMTRTIGQQELLDANRTVIANKLQLICEGNDNTTTTAAGTKRKRTKY